MTSTPKPSLRCHFKVGTTLVDNDLRVLFESIEVQTLKKSLTDTRVSNVEFVTLRKNIGEFSGLLHP